MAALVLRIFPGLVLAVLACFFVLGPIVTTLSVRDYFLSPGTWTFLREMTLYRTFDALPGVFTQGHFTSAVDSVLWTLPVEWTMYIVVLFGALIYRGRTYLGSEPKVRIIEILVALALTLQMMPIQHDQHAKSWVSYFVLGSLCYLTRKWIPLIIPIAILLMGVDITLIGITGGLGDLGNRMMPVALGYFLLTVGFHPALVFKGFLRAGDYSYGLYIFALPVQQTLLTYIHDSPWLLFIATYIPTLIIATLSWRFVERPSLTLKDKWSGRRTY
jgi:peptidoglycan/LPS O-acetylase OafA/YrhL